MLEDLVIFEMANSHQGDLDHGIKIIKAMGQIAKKYKINAAVKLQYREYDKFIHPDYKDRKDVKHIDRFLSTRLEHSDFTKMVSVIKEEGMLAMSTPFDEDSVNLCIEQNLDIIKVASCSAKDWPLLEKVASAGKPVILSTGGLKIKDIDNLYNFFQHRNCKFAMLHCVAIYPAPSELLQLDIIDKMKRRYPDILIGYSGHESPDDVIVPSMVIAKGAQILERHVGYPTETIKLNAYSMNPEQTDKWVETIVNARKICKYGKDKTVTPDEIKSLESLSRGVWAKNKIKKGNYIKKEDVFFSMPYLDGQLKSGELKTGIVASQDYTPLAPIMEKPLDNTMKNIRTLIHDVKGMLNEAGIILGKNFSVELSHHYGMENYKDYGCAIVNVINREYCKKLLVMLPNQKHPSHYHKLKEETFQILSGDMELIINDEKVNLTIGETYTVKRNDWHSFSTKNGLIFEEVSTTHYRNDSFYEDSNIAELDPMQRKTILDLW